MRPNPDPLPELRRELDAPAALNVRHPPVPRQDVPHVLWYEVHTSETLESGQMHTGTFVLDSYQAANSLIGEKCERSIDFTYRLHLVHLLAVGEGERFTPIPGVAAGPHAGYRYEFRQGSYRTARDEDGGVFHLLEIRNGSNRITRYSAALKNEAADETRGSQQDPAALWRELEEESPHMIHHLDPDA